MCVFLTFWFKFRSVSIQNIWDWSQQFNLSANATRDRPSYFSLIMLTLLSVLVLVEYGSSWLYYSLCIAFPIFMTLKTIETANIEKQRHWLAYWAISSLILAFNGRKVFFCCFPGYELLNIAFHIWLYSEKSQGANFLYKKLLSPFIKKYRSKIDKKINYVRKTVVKSIMG